MTKKGRKKLFRGNRIFYMIFLVLGIYVSSIFVNQQIKLHGLLQEEAVAKEKISTLKKEIAHLQGEMQQADTPEYIEKVAREKLKMVGPHEIIYIDQSKEKDTNE